MNDDDHHLLHVQPTEDLNFCLMAQTQGDRQGLFLFSNKEDCILFKVCFFFKDGCPKPIGHFQYLELQADSSLYPLQHRHLFCSHTHTPQPTPCGSKTWLIGGLT